MMVCCIAPKMSPWAAMSDGYAINVGIIDCFHSRGVESVRSVVLISTHPSTDLRVLSKYWECHWWAATVNTSPTSSLVGCGIGDLTKTTWTPTWRISHVNVSNSSPLGAIYTTLCKCTLYVYDWSTNSVHFSWDILLQCLQYLVKLVLAENSVSVRPLQTWWTSRSRTTSRTSLTFRPFWPTKPSLTHQTWHPRTT